MGRSLVERVQEHYREFLPMARRWDDPEFLYSWRNPIGRYQRERIRRALLELLTRNRVPINADPILDIGCGTGDWLRFFAEVRGTTSGLIGVELSVESLQRGVMINPGVFTIQADARALPFRDRSFLIISQFVTFEHLVDLESLRQACLELTRVCSPGGWLIWYDLLPVHSEIQRGFTEADVRELFSEFEVMDRQPVFRTYTLLGRQLSTGYAVARRSSLIADLLERFLPGKANNLLLLLQHRGK